MKHRFSPLALLGTDPINWSKRKNMAVDAAVKAVMKAMSDVQPASDSDSESDNSSDGMLKILSNNFPYNRQCVQNFFDALKHNYIFDSTFHDPGILAKQEFCYCPCCKKMGKWR